MTNANISQKYSNYDRPLSQQPIKVQNEHNLTSFLLRFPCSLNLGQLVRRWQNDTLAVGMIKFREDFFFFFYR